MRNNPIVDADETNKLTESRPIAELAIAPAADEVLSLREAAKQLAELAPSKKGEKIADAKLLQLLKVGKVRAGFHVPGDVPIWVQIPISYWVKTSANNFKKIRIEPSKKRKGEYNVYLESFPAEYAEARSRAATQALSAAELLLEFVRHGSDPFGVMLAFEEWARFKATLPAPRPEFVQESGGRKKGGRNELASWKDVMGILAAYLLKRNIRSSDDESCESIASNVLEIAKTMNVDRLPRLTTLEKEVSRVLGLIHSSQFKSI